MSELETMFVEMASLFYARGLSVNEMIQGAYEAQLAYKRANGKPAQANVKEKNKE